MVGNDVVKAVPLPAPVKDMPGKAPDNFLDSVGKLSWMLGIFIGIEFIIIGASFALGHYMGQQTVAQTITVEAPIVQAENDYVIDAHINMRETQKQPAEIKVIMPDNAASQATATQKFEEVQVSISELKASVAELRDGQKRNEVEASSKPVAENQPPKPLKIKAPSVTQTKPVEKKVEANAEKSQGELLPPPLNEDPNKRLSAAEKLDRLMKVAQRYVYKYEGTNGREATGQWERWWRGRVEDRGGRENQLANEELIGHLVSIKGRQDKGEEIEPKQMFETCLLLLRYKMANMQLPSPVLEIIMDEDETKFEKAMGFIEVATNK